jgi:hypothetical protein
MPGIMQAAAWLGKLAAAAALIGLAGCGSSSKTRTPEPVRSEGRQDEEGADRRQEKPRGQRDSKDITCEVAYVIDPRLPRLDREQLDTALNLAADWGRREQGREVRFDLRDTYHIDVFFGRYGAVLDHPDAEQARREQRLSGQSPEDLAALEADILKCAGQFRDEDWRRYFPEAPQETKGSEAWAAYAFKSFKQRHAALYRGDAENRPLVDAERSELSSPWYWRAIAAQGEYDLIVTNVLIAEPERQMDLARLARGGVSTGVTVAARGRAQTGRTAVVSVQPVLCRYPFSLDLPEETALRHFAYYLWYRLQKPPDQPGERADPLTLAAEMARRGPPQPRTP